ncbi:MAG: hypothetical protein QM538_02630 [Methylacidiphilales bacterium]|nr:hypothetical protein [Candidatus Methylacidiphilales bacterium]
MADLNLNQDLTLSSLNTKFVGNGHTITLISNASNFALDDDRVVRKALIKVLGSEGKVENLRIHVNFNLTLPPNVSQFYIAPLIAENYGVIKSVRTTGTINVNYNNSQINSLVPTIYIGGIVGSNSGSFCKDEDGSCGAFNENSEISVSFVRINATAGYINTYDTPHIFAGGVVGRDEYNSISQLIPYTRYSLDSYTDWDTPLPQSIPSNHIQSLNNFAVLNRDGTVNYSDIYRSMFVFDDHRYKYRYSSGWGSWHNFSYWNGFRCKSGTVSPHRRETGTHYISLNTDKLTLRLHDNTSKNYITITSQCLSNICLADILAGNKDFIYFQEAHRNPPRFRGIQLNSIIGLNCLDQYSDDKSIADWISYDSNRANKILTPVSNARPNPSGNYGESCKGE